MRHFRLPPSAFSLLAVLAASSPLLAADAKVTFDDDVLPVFRTHCGTCHNGADRRGGLVLDDYNGLMQGGASGDVVIGGDSDLSYLYMLVTHEDTPVMPPNAPKIPDADIAKIKAWIDGGLLQNKGSKAKKAAPNPALAKVTVSTARPEGPPPMPGRYLGDPAAVPPRPNSVTGLAVNPWSPLAAVAGHEQVTLLDTGSLVPLGTLAFPEGTPNILKFSQNGSLLMAAGGRGGASGVAALFDVATGQRIATVGNEYDALTAADLSPDLQLIAAGTPKKMLRVYRAGDGSVAYESDKHTDWLTAAAFSPDGVLLASADRSGGLVVWEAETGREFHILGGHKDAVTAVAWRGDSNVMATSSLTGEVKLWEMNEGREVGKFNPGVGGVTDVAYTRDGRLLVTGRNGRVKLTDAAGKVQKDFGTLGDEGMRVAFDEEGKRVLAGGWNGRVMAWDAESAAKLGDVPTNLPGAGRVLALVESSHAAWVKKRDAAAAGRQKIQNAVAARAKAAKDAAAAIAKAEADRKAANSARNKAVNDQTAARKALDAHQQKVAAGQKAHAAAVAARDQAVKTSQAANQQVVTTTDARGKAVAAETAARRALAAAAGKTGEDKPSPEELSKLTEAVASAASAAESAAAAASEAAEKSKAAREAMAAAEAAMASARKTLDASAAERDTTLAAVNALGETIKQTTAAMDAAGKAITAAQAAHAAAKKAAPQTEAEGKQLKTFSDRVNEANAALERLDRQKQRLTEVLANNV